MRSAALAALLLTGCADHRVVLVIGAGDDPAAEVARRLPGCRAVETRDMPGPLPKRAVVARCTHSMEGHGDG